MGLRERIHPRWVVVAAAFLAVGGLSAAAVSSLLADPLPEAGPAEPLSDQELLDAFGAVDSDRDGLADAIENYRTGTDPLRWNTTGTVVPDGWLARHGYDALEPGAAFAPAALPPRDRWPAFAAANYPPEYQATLADVYAHGRPADWDEAADGPWDSGLDPTDWDSDDDGVPDGYVLRHGLDPTAALAQQRLAGPDGLTVAEAYLHGTDPRSLDSDADGLRDTQELAGPADPTRPGRSFPPTDPRLASSSGSGACDGFLVANGLDPLDAAVAATDPDRDGATVLEEHDWNAAHVEGFCSSGQGLDPLDAQSGDAGLPDGWLVRYDLDPFEPGVAQRVTQTASQDPGPAPPPGTADLSITVADEYAAGRPEAWGEAVDGPWWGGSDPTLADTDADGLGDAWELRGYVVRAVTEVGSGAAEPTTVHPDPSQADGDADGLSDLAEATGSSGKVTDATRRDTDLDGLSDGAEGALQGLDPTRADSAGDLLTDGERLRLLATLAAAYAPNPTYPGGEPGTGRRVLDWLGSVAGAPPGGSLSSDQIRQLVGPDGNIDGDPLKNLVDPDADGDGLLNGWEHDPDLFRRSPFGTGNLPGGRPATDPVNPDTDGDGLEDGWETEHALPNVQLVRLVPDPSRWNSDDELEGAGQKENDGLEDPDGDSIDWFTFTETATGYQTVQNRFTYDNLREQQSESTDPNQRFSDEDGLLDGWKYFWSEEYPSLSTDALGDLYPGGPDGPLAIPAGATRPEVGTDQTDLDTAEDPLATTRFAPFSAATPISGLLREHETASTVHPNVPRQDGTRRDIVEIRGAWPFTLQDMQAAGSNPYMQDTDGDGLSDHWEWVHRSMPPHGTCRTSGGPNPTVYDSGSDPDGDGLTNAQEEEEETHPLCPDHDQGGLPDGEEVELGLDASDPTDDFFEDNQDQDGDGVSDLRERRELGTSPLDPDTDGDGLLDGGNVPAGAGLAATAPVAERFLDLGIAYTTSCTVATRPCPEASLRFTFLGEGTISTDPTDGDPAQSGVPQGWLVVHGLDPAGGTVTPTIRAAYRMGMPTWWDPVRHGVWWGGALASELNNPGGVDRTDLDADGLLDLQGEDPYPGVNHYNQLREVDWDLHGLGNLSAEDPRDESLPAVGQQLLAQALLNPVHRDSQRASREPSPGSLASDGLHHPRVASTLTELAAPAGARRGGTFQVTGRLLAGGTAVPDATVVAEIDGETLGAAFTGADGRFAMTVELKAAHSVAIPPSAFALMGERSGTAAWTADLEEVELGARTLVVRSYATPNTEPHTDSWRPVLRDEATLPFTVTARPVLDIDAPDEVRTEEDATISVRAVDEADVPLRDSVRLEVGSFYSRTVTPDLEGLATFTVRVPHASAGTLQAVAHYVPGGSVEAGTASEPVLALRVASITVETVPRVVAGDPFAVSGRLTAPGGGVPGVPVHASLGGATGTAITAGDGGYRITLTAPTDLAGDTLSVFVEAERGPKTTVASKATIIDLVGRPILLVDADPMELGEPATVSGVLLRPDRTPLPEATVDYALGSIEGSAETDEEGRFSEPVTPPRWGLASLTVSFGGDDHHESVNTTVQRAVLSDTTLLFGSGAVARGRAAELSFTLLDRLGGPVPGMGLSVQWGTEPAQAVVTDGQGVAHLDHPTDPTATPGPVLVKAVFAGSPDGALFSSSAQATWTVRAEAAFALEDPVLVAGQPAPAVRLVDAANGAALTGRAVTATIGTVKQSYTTGAGGAFLPLPSPAADAEPDAFDLVLAFAGDTLYPKAAATVPILVKTPTSLQASAPDLPRGQGTTLPFTLADLAGRPVAGPVQALLSGQPAGNGTAAAGAGRVVVQVPADEPLGPARLVLSFPGDDGHLPSSVEMAVRVVRATTLELRVREGEDNTTLVVAAVALSEGEPLPDAVLHLSVEGMPGGLTATTDGEGRAEFPIPSNHADEALVVRLESTEAWTAAAASARLTPTEEAAVAASPWRTWAVAGGLVALAAVAGLVYLLRGRSEISLTFAEARERVLARGPVEAGILAAYDVLETAALRLGWIAGRATTPRRLEQVLAPRLPPSVHADLDALVALFEEARYAQTAMEDTHRQAARRALGRIRAGAAWRGAR